MILAVNNFCRSFVSAVAVYICIGGFLALLWLVLFMAALLVVVAGWWSVPVLLFFARWGVALFD